MKLFLAFLFFGKQPNLCINCEHFIENKNKQYSKCRFFLRQNKDHFLITGEHPVQEEDFNYCTTMREYESYCGQKGKKFKPKHVD